MFIARMTPPERDATPTGVECFLFGRWFLYPCDAANIRTPHNESPNCVNLCLMDVHNKATRSYNMSRIKGKNTKPEWLVRRFLLMLLIIR